jgi:hypothetical protein
MENDPKRSLEPRRAETCAHIDMIFDLLNVLTRG